MSWKTNKACRWTGLIETRHRVLFDAPKFSSNYDYAAKVPQAQKLGKKNRLHFLNKYQQIVDNMLMFNGIMKKN